MRTSEFRRRMKAGALSRRQFHAALAAAGLAAIAVPLNGRRTRAQEQAVYFTWSEYDNPEFFPAYVQKHGANPDMPIFADEEEALQKLRAGATFDVVHPCNNSLPRWRDAGILQAIDTTRLSHWPDVFDSLKTFEGAQADGKQYFVPVDWGNTSIIYRTDLVDIAEESWTLMWDERYAGKLSMAAAAEESVTIASIVAGANDPFDPTDEEIEKAKQLLLKQKPLLRFYWDTTATVEQALAAGELVASTGWNDSAVQLKAQGIPVKFMKPKEGILTYCCGLVLTKDAPHVDAAHDLIDAMIAPEAGKWLVEQQGFGHSNRKTFEIVDPQILAERDLPADPTEFLSAGIQFKPYKRLEDVSSMFEAVKAGF